MKLAIALGAAVSICTAADARPLDDRERALIETALAEQLKDPDSMKVQHGEFTPGKTVYCARFNARNSYGGYAGFAPFLAAITLDRGAIVAVRYVMTENAPDLCAKLAK